jgi:hypothetical protein
VFRYVLRSEGCVLVPRSSGYVGLTNFGSELEKCVGSRVHLFGVSISFEKNFNRLPFTPPLSGSSYRSFSCQFLSELAEAPRLARFDTFLARSSEFVISSGLVPGLLGVMFTSLHDLYWASRFCHKVLDELIPEVLLSTLKPYINTKLQNRHARMNLLYQRG